MAPDLHRRRHLFIFDSEWFVGEVELADLLDHRELTVDAVDRGADRGAEFLMFAEQLHILGQSLGTIGRASCRERVCQYVYVSVVAVSLKKKTRYKEKHKKTKRK